MNTSLPTYASIILNTFEPFPYLISYDSCDMLLGSETSAFIGCEFFNASMVYAPSVWSRRKSPKNFQSGLVLSTVLNAKNVAKLSLSHRSFHHFIVTRSPNHICTSSCVITSAVLL